MPGRDHIRWYERIRTKLTLVATLAIILPILVFYLISTRITLNAFLDEAREDLEVAVEHESDMLTGFINDTARHLFPSAYDPELTGLSFEELALYLSFLLRREPPLDSVSVVALDGKERGRASRTVLDLPDQLRDLSDSDALDAAGKGKTFFGDPFISSEGEPMMIIAVPLRDQFDKITGMLMASLSLRNVLAVVGKAVEPFLYVYVVDRQGTVIAHPDYSVVLKRSSLRNTAVVSDALSLSPGRRTSMMRYTNVLGQDVLGLGVRSEVPGWSVIGEIPTERALAGVAHVRRIFDIVLAAAAVVGFVASLYIGSKASGLIVRIQRAAQAIGGGDFEKRVPVIGGGELEQLAGDLNIMGDKLQEYHDHMERDVEDLNKRVAERTASLQKAFNELQQRDIELKQTQAALVQTEKLAAMGRLVAGVVHEVNNPLAYITNNVQVLQRDITPLADLGRRCLRALEAEDPSQRDDFLRQARELGESFSIDDTLSSLDRILSSTSEGLRNIRKIVTDLRDFSRMGGVEPEPIDLNRAVESTLAMVAYELRRKDITVETNFAELPLVECTPVKINQVVLNILLNAIQAVPEKGHIWITTKLEDERVAIGIRDDGHGIPEEIMPKIFEPFFTTAPRGEGTGLGLSVSYGIIQEHGGTIDVSSVPGEGAEFTVTLPVRQKKAEETASAAELSA